MAAVKGVAADAVADYLRSADVYQVGTQAGVCRWAWATPLPTTGWNPSRQRSPTVTAPCMGQQKMFLQSEQRPSLYYLVACFQLIYKTARRLAGFVRLRKTTLTHEQSSGADRYDAATVRSAGFAADRAAGIR